MLDTELDTLYESETRQVPQPIGRYKLPEFVELLDGWRRVNALRDFYADRFQLKGLEAFPRSAQNQAADV